MKMIKKKRIADADLILLIRKGNKRGVEKLFDSYGMFLFLAISRIVQTDEQAEEVLTKSFKKIWSSIDEYVAGKEKIYTWMIAIARNLALETYEYQKKA